MTTCLALVSASAAQATTTAWVALATTTALVVRAAATALVVLAATTVLVRSAATTAFFKRLICSCTNSLVNKLSPFLKPLVFTSFDTFDSCSLKYIIPVNYVLRILSRCVTNNERGSSEFLSTFDMCNDASSDYDPGLAYIHRSLNLLCATRAYKGIGTSLSTKITNLASVTFV